MPYRYVLTAAIPGSPEEVYETWLDSRGHSEMTGADAIMSDQIGAEFSAWDGYISGRNLELVPGRRIVQSWRTSEFTDAHGDSVLTVTLQHTDDGTLLTLEHSNVPDEQRSYEEEGWQSNYFEPMVAYFTARKRKITPASAKKTAAKTATRVKRTKRTEAGKTRPRKSAKTAVAKRRRVAPRGRKAAGRKRGKRR